MVFPLLFNIVLQICLWITSLRDSLDYMFFDPSINPVFDTLGTVPFPLFFYNLIDPSSTAICVLEHPGVQVAFQ